MLDTLFTIFLIQVNDYLGITPSIEMMSFLFQSIAQFEIVENLSILYDPYRLVFIGNWLVAGFEIDHLQPSHAKAHIAG
jgi:hypothetical protein